MSVAIANPHLWSRLAKYSVERTYRGQTPAKTITAPEPELKPQDPDKGLFPQREAYFAQSAATVAGRVAPFPSAPAGEPAAIPAATAGAAFHSQE